MGDVSQKEEVIFVYEVDVDRELKRPDFLGDDEDKIRWGLANMIYSLGSAIQQGRGHGPYGEMELAIFPERMEMELRLYTEGINQKYQLKLSRVELCAKS